MLSATLAPMLPLLSLFVILGLAQTPTEPPAIPTLRAGLGTCSASFTVTDAAGATIRVHDGRLVAEPSAG